MMHEGEEDDDENNNHGNAIKNQDGTIRPKIKYAVHKDKDEEVDEVVKYTFADIPLDADHIQVKQINKGNAEKKRKSKRLSLSQKNGFAMEFEVAHSSSNYDETNRSVSDSGTVLFTTAASTVQQEMIKFWNDPGRSLRKMRHKLSTSAKNFFDNTDGVSKDSYHYASVVVSDSNSRKNPFSTYDDDDEIDDCEFEVEENGYYYGNAYDINTVGEERITIRRLSSLVFTLLSISCSSTLSAIPPFILVFAILQNIVNKWYISFPFALLRMVDNMSTTFTLSRCKNPMAVGSIISTTPVILISFIELVLYNHMLPYIYNEVNEHLFIQPDGSISLEWVSYKNAMGIAVMIGYILVVARILIILSGILVGLSSKWPNTFDQSLKLSPGVTKLLLETRDSWYCYQFQIYLLHATLIVSVVTFTICISSLVTYVLYTNNSSSSRNTGMYCDSLDNTECILPFPSSKFLEVDASSETGYRVSLSEDILFDLKGSRRFHPGYLNHLDGFSTSGPILFYIDGLKEGGGNGLQGPEFIEHSITAKSVTLLLDVDKDELVHHFAEIDYLDNERPLVIIQPAKPLNHNTAYAVLVHNAVGLKDGDFFYLDPTPGFRSLMSDEFHDNSFKSNRSKYFKTTLLPAFYKAAPWLKQDKNIQLMFDFHTVSADSQLGNIRSIRDTVISMARNKKWDFDHTVTKVVNHDCRKHNLARTIYADINVPWFLENYGDGHRGSLLDAKKVSHESEVFVGRAKFVTHIPCSVMVNAMEVGGGKEVRAVVDYGHGLFYTMEEAEDSTFLHRLANDNGYIIVAMDWRGMSRYDMPVILNMLLDDPSKVEIVRDNIIQGYANKIALIEYINDGFFDMEPLSFDSNPIRFMDNKKPSMILYGISQGGILGAGYAALLGSSDIIDRSILGVPGTPISFILSRSGDFSIYNKIMLFNFYNNRHIRIYLSLFQMAFDSVGASGHLAGLPFDENIPRVLIQAGIGDSEVSYISAEILARAFGAVRLPNSPKKIYGVPEREAADNDSEGPKSVLTEILYQKEADSLPQTNNIPPSNNVHFCVRQDLALRSQITDFINSAKITNPCVTDQCIRHAATHCGII